MKRNIILTIGLLGYLTYILRYIKVLPYFPSPELLLRIIIWIIIAIIITGKLILSCNNNQTAKPKIHKVHNTSKKKTKTITPFDKKFKKSYAKTSKKFKNEVQEQDSKSAYIESAWNEVNKI